MEFIDLKSQYRLIEDDVGRRIRQVLEHGHFIMGPEVGELEDRLADYVGAKHCITVSSGTDALLISLMALGIGPDDEVITTPFTFVAAGEVIAVLGATPVFVDIDPRTYNIDPALIEVAITPKTKAIIPVSLYGLCADIDPINEIAARFGLHVVEDGAQSFGALYKQKHSCSLSEIGCTSFYPSKPLGGYGDGGACFTDDENLATLMRQLRVHGQDGRYHHAVIGVNGRLDTLQAAVLLAKLELFPGEIEARQRVAEGYTNLLEGAVTTPLVEPHSMSVFSQYTIQVDDRDGVAKRLNDEGVPTAIHYPVPLNLQPAFHSLGLSAGSFPKAEAAASRVMCLPMHPYLEHDDIESIADKVKRACGV